ncbi:hypothetical protein PIB30_065150 [Stylosanthes scabra]|uniref:Uncharacterized protein n=1 Tax=Stylosanthes scabra TaxID=79078 RepID=A0ABU6YJG8_9FABA|nr:hypothetical protein [Stylosanthes scabra]
MKSEPSLHASSNRKIDGTTRKTSKRVHNSQAWPKNLKLPSGGNVTDQPLGPKLLRNKAANEWPTNKRESSKIGNIQCNLNRSQEDLDYPQLYKQGASPPQALGHAVGFVTKGTSSYLEHRGLAPHSKSFGQSLRDPTLTAFKHNQESFHVSLCDLEIGM